MSLPVPPDHLPFTGDPDADALIATNPLALLIGFALDQQVTVQKAFSGPLEMQRRAVPLDAAAIAAMDPEALATIFRTPPALHRFPGNMAGRVQDLCARSRPTTAATRRGSGRRRWTRKDLHKRLIALPGIGRDEGRARSSRCSAPATGSSPRAGRRSARRRRRSATSTPPRRSPSTRPASGRARPRRGRPRPQGLMVLSEIPGDRRDAHGDPHGARAVAADPADVPDALEPRRVDRLPRARSTSGSSIWISYGFSIWNWALIISNAASLTFMTITILVALSFRRPGRRRDLAGAWRTRKRRPPGRREPPLDTRAVGLRRSPRPPWPSAARRSRAGS